MPEEQSVRTQSLLALSYTSGLGGVLGNLLGGTLIQPLGLQPLLLLSAGLCACGAALMALCARRHKRQAARPVQ